MIERTEDKGREAEARRLLNQHLWHYHRNRDIKGSLYDRLAGHDLLHAESNEYPYAGKPRHRHEAPTSTEDFGEVVLHEDEGT